MIIQRLVKINFEVVDNGRTCNNIIPHIERELWNLKLPTIQADEYYFCFGWIKLELIGLYLNQQLFNTPY